MAYDPLDEHEDYASIFFDDHSGDESPPKEKDIEEYKKYFHCCHQIEKQIEAATGIQLPSNSNLTYEQYQQLCVRADETTGNVLRLVISPRVLVVNNTVEVKNDGPPGDQGDADGPTAATDKVEYVQVNNEEVFVYANQLIIPGEP